MQIYRYRNLYTAVERNQTKWVIFGVSIVLLGFSLFTIGPHILISPTYYSQGGLWMQFIINLGIRGSLIMIPVSLGIAIFRYRLWDIDLLINRTILYGSLTAIVSGIYIFIVGFIGAKFLESENLIISVMATAIITICFVPLRNRLQSMINRMMYGDREDPYGLIVRLGKQLARQIPHDQMLPEAASTIKEALRLPYVAIEIISEEKVTIAASAGKSDNGLERIPLVHGGQEAGHLVLAQRSREEPFTPSERNLLEGLARQVGAAVQSVRLTRDLQQLAGDLQRSREHLVLAREEERRRIRRNLHDELAPTLAALALNASTAEDLIESDTEAAKRLIKQLRSSIRETVQDIRRLAYDLRPPALDQLGLVAAIRERALQINNFIKGFGIEREKTLHVTVTAPQTLPSLPAAVEVATYWVVQEALMNVIRHSGAGNCSVKLEMVNKNGHVELAVDIEDDGVGSANHEVSHRISGIGIQVMRERVEEIGGRLLLETREFGGTCVKATIPISKVTLVNPET